MVKEDPKPGTTLFTGKSRGEQLLETIVLHSQVMPEATQVLRKDQELAFDFEFRNAPWSQVLDWFTEKSGLTMTGVFKLRGTFTFVTPRGKKYTISEIVDILNDALQAAPASDRWLLVRRNQTYTLVPADEPIEPTLAQRIPPENLPKYGKTEVVQVVVTLKGLAAKDVQPTLQKMKTPFGQVAVIEPTNQLVLTDTVASLNKILKVIKTGEYPTEVRANQFVNESKYLKVYPLTGGDAKETAKTLMEWFGPSRVRVAPINDNSLMIYAAPLDQLTIAKMMQPYSETTGSPKPRTYTGPAEQMRPSNSPLLKVYPVKGGNATTIVQMLSQSSYQQSTVVKMSALNNNSILVYAPPADHFEIAKLIQDQNGSGWRQPVTREVLPQLGAVVVTGNNPQDMDTFRKITQNLQSLGSSAGTAPVSGFGGMGYSGWSGFGGGGSPGFIFRGQDPGFALTTNSGFGSTTYSTQGFPGGVSNTNFLAGNYANPLVGGLSGISGSGQFGKALYTLTTTNNNSLGMSSGSSTLRPGGSSSLLGSSMGSGGYGMGGMGVTGSYGMGGAGMGGYGIGGMGGYGMGGMGGFGMGMPGMMGGMGYGGMGMMGGSGMGGKGGFFTYAEFECFRQTNPLEHPPIGFRGFFDTTGLQTGHIGQWAGDPAMALDAKERARFGGFGGRVYDEYSEGGSSITARNYPNYYTPGGMAGNKVPTTADRLFDGFHAGMAINFGQPMDIPPAGPTTEPGRQFEPMYGEIQRLVNEANQRMQQYLEPRFAQYREALIKEIFRLQGEIYIKRQEIYANSRKKEIEAIGMVTQSPNLRLVIGDSLLYRRPTLDVQDNLFRDLLAYAPGLQTHAADVLAVLEAEGGFGTAPTVGTIEPAARDLIDRARSCGWETVTLSPLSAETLTCDGSGRYACEHMLPSGLKEQVVCDGKNLLHLYPDLGLGARRRVSAFHREELATLLPWALPPANDLARGTDVICFGERVVALVPHGARAGEGLAVHLVFAEEGRLAERRLIDRGTGKILGRETYSAEGVVRVVDANDKEVQRWTLQRRPAQAPNLEPNLARLVVLPVPFRSREHIVQTRQPRFNGTNYDILDEETALRLAASYAATHDAAALSSLVCSRFLGRGDQRLGFATLLLSAGCPLNSLVLSGTDLGDLVARFRYLASLRLGHGLVPSLVEAQGLLEAWRNPTWPASQAECARLLRYVEEGKTPLLTYAVVDALLGQPQRKVAWPGGLPDFLRQVLYAASTSLKNFPGLAYPVRYELARHLAKNGDRTEARNLFTRLYRDVMDEGSLPPIDRSFRAALHEDKTSPDPWADLMHQTAAWLIKKDQRVPVIALAWQCWELDSPQLAEELRTAALAGIKEAPERNLVRVAVLNYLTQTDQVEKANQLVQEMLADPAWANHPGLWRLGWRLAGKRKQMPRAFECLAQALELEYRFCPEEVNGNALRADYQTLLNHYAQRAVLQTGSPREVLVKQVVRAADRWRALDPGGEACEMAWPILCHLGAYDLAWDYLLTARVLGSGQTAPIWGGLANLLMQSAEGNLAERLRPGVPGRARQCRSSVAAREQSAPGR